MPPFKPKSNDLKAPSIGGGKSSGIAQLMAMMIEQNKGQNATQTSQQVQQMNPAPGTKGDFGSFSGEINPKRTVEEAQSMSGADVINTHINKIKEAQGDPDLFRSAFQKATFKGTGKDKGQVFGFPLTYGDKNAIDLKFSLDDMSNRLLYLFSGKQINEQEFQRLSGTLPSYTDISDPTDNTFSSLNNKLDTYKMGLDGIKNRLIKGGLYDEKYWNGPIENTGAMGSQSMNIQGPRSPIPGSPGYQNIQPSNNPQLQVPQGPGGSQPTFVNPSQQSSQGNDVRSQYNQLRSQGMSADEAKKQLGL